jgi:hypothetical protein
MHAIEDVYGELGVPFIRIASRSGTGFHPKVIFSGFESPAAARAWQSKIVLIAGLPASTEIYPKQDAKTNIGNLIALPGSFYWNHKAQTKKNRPGSWLLDDAWNAVPIEQWKDILTNEKNHVTHEQFLEFQAKTEEKTRKTWFGPPKEEFVANNTVGASSNTSGSKSSENRSFGDNLFAWNSSDLERCLTHGGLSFEVQDYSKGSWTHKYTLARCPFTERHSLVNGAETPEGSAVFFDTNTGRIGFKCQHAHCKDVDWQTARAKIDPTKKVKKEISGPVRPILPPDKPAKKPKKNPAASRVEFKLVEKKTEAPADSEPKSKLEQVFVDDFEFGGIDKSPSDELIYFLERKSKNEVEFSDVPEEVLRESEDTEEAEEADGIDKLFETPYMREPGEEEDLPDLRPKPPRVRFKTQQRMRLYGYNVLRAKWEQRIADNKNKSPEEKEKEIKRCNGFNTTWNKITSCAQCSWRRLGSLGTEKVIPLFCERSALCIKCAEYNRKMYKLWTEMEWKDGYYTLIEKRCEFKSHSHRDIDEERRMLIKDVIKPSGAKKMKQRYFEGYSKNVYIGEEDMYFAIRKLKAPKRESDLLGLDFHIGSWTTVKRLSKAEVIDYLFGDDGFWCEPAKAFFKINMQLDKAIFDGDAEEIQLKYMNQLAEFPFMEGWHKKRTNGNKSGKEMFPLPDKKAINAMCKAERLKKHPEEADSTEVFDNGALYWFKRKVVDVPKSLEKEWEKAKFIKDAHSSALVFMCKPDSTLNKLWGRADRLKAEAAQAKAEGKLFLFPAGFAAAG